MPKGSGCVIEAIYALPPPPPQETKRACVGIFQGFLFPSCYAVLRHWTIPEERSRMGAITLFGEERAAVAIAVVTLTQTLTLEPDSYSCGAAAAAAVTCLLTC